MVGAHGGRVEVAAGIDGLGTRIALWLPLPSPPAADAEVTP
jgi:two-component system sensor histidine kinase KdpD